MSAQHTPGPWLCVPDARNYGDGQDTLAWEIVGTNGRKVVDLDNFHYSEEEVEANARLIAAAPEMLAMLQELAAEGEVAQGDLLRLIAKAAGSAA